MYVSMPVSTPLPFSMPGSIPFPNSISFSMLLPLFDFVEECVLTPIVFVDLLSLCKFDLMFDLIVGLYPEFVSDVELVFDFVSYSYNFSKF